MVSRVDLPEPLGPMIATISPASTHRFTPVKACTSAGPDPYTLDTSRISSTGVIGPSSLADACPEPVPEPAWADAVAGHRQRPATERSPPAGRAPHRPPGPGRCRPR